MFRITVTSTRSHADTPTRRRQPRTFEKLLVLGWDAWKGSTEGEEIFDKLTSESERALRMRRAVSKQEGRKEALPVSVHSEQDSRPTQGGRWRGGEARPVVH